MRDRSKRALSRVTDPRVEVPPKGLKRFAELLQQRRLREVPLPTADRRGRVRRAGPRRPRPKPPVGTIPSSLTLGNAICGLMSLAVSTGQLGLFSDATRLYIASALVFAGMLFDVLDGQAARRLRQSSNFGVQLDSLADAITFGAAPMFLLQAFDRFVPSPLLLAIGVGYACCAILRLAYFNTQTGVEDKHEGFSGLPSPAAAGTVAGVALAYAALPRWEGLLASFSPNLLPAIENLLHIAAPVMAVVAAGLMVSRIRYRHAANHTLKHGLVSVQLTLVAMAFAVAVIYIREFAVLLAFAAFAYVPPTLAALRPTPSKLRSKDGAAPGGTVSNPAEQ